MTAPSDSGTSAPDAKGYARPEMLVSTEWLAAHLDDPTLRIVESDEDVLLYETGHIPGAVKVDWHLDLNDPVTRDYVDGEASHCLAMLFGEGGQDHATYAAALPLDHEPGTVWNYSSGTTNIICRILGDVVGGGAEGMGSFLRDRLIAPAGMTSASPRFDDAGTWVGSSYVYATAGDFARFGELYRRDGVAVTGERVLPSGWIDHGRTFVAHDDASSVPGGFDYGRHWWMWPRYPGSIAAHGYEGQYIVVVPDRDLTVVHLGKTPTDARHLLVARLDALIADIPVSEAA